MRARPADKRLLELTFQTENRLICRARMVMAISLRMHTWFGGVDFPESMLQRISEGVSLWAFVSNEFTQRAHPQDTSFPCSGSALSSLQ